MAVGKFVIAIQALHPEITTKAMFGGYGVYLRGVICGIIVDSQLYLKVDSTNRERYEKMKSTPFTYQGHGGKPYAMSYWLVSGKTIQEHEKILELLEESYEVSMRSKRKKNEKTSN
ncbi:MAG: TfoX/Sxy family protein [Patescibacteria group bacterium]